MKSFDQTRIRQAEAVQLIVLQSLFSLRESREVIFQGGTAIRWFHGGMRFSEDLDFVTALTRPEVTALMESAGRLIRRQVVANFGPGSFSVKEKRYHPSSYKAFIDFIPIGSRSRISVKVEFEKLVSGAKPESETKIMQASPTISYFFREGGLKSPGAQTIVNVETTEEILSDKLRALLERPYTKGRDFFDVWFLTETLRAEPKAGLLKRKLDMYEIPFTLSRALSFYTRLDSLKGKARQALSTDLHQDLARFLAVDTIENLEQNGHRDLILAVQNAFKKIEEERVIDFSKYPERSRPSV
ncbi:MAG: nucleotidyl transferase AbiEii/AbiGii toxin family protein [Thermodesulfobacteriota bacterium]